MCADVERRPSASITVLSVHGQKRFSIDASQPAERKPHTRVDDESEIEKKYSVGEVLGQGSFGVVREVTNKLTGQKFAMKIVNKEKVSHHVCHCCYHTLPFMGKVQICVIGHVAVVGLPNNTGRPVIALYHTASNGLILGNSVSKCPVLVTVFMLYLADVTIVAHTVSN